MNEIDSFTVKYLTCITGSSHDLNRPAGSGGTQQRTRNGLKDDIDRAHRRKDVWNCTVVRATSEEPSNSARRDAIKRDVAYAQAEDDDVTTETLAGASQRVREGFPMEPGRYSCS